MVEIRQVRRGKAVDGFKSSAKSISTLDATANQNGFAACPLRPPPPAKTHQLCLQHPFHSTVELKRLFIVN